MDKPKYNDMKDVYWSKDNAFNVEITRPRGPCFVASWGEVRFAENTKSNINRSVGPSYIHPRGGIAYYKCGNLHRINGPAVIGIEGSEEYWINGSKLSQLEFFATTGVM